MTGSRWPLRIFFIAAVLLALAATGFITYTTLKSDALVESDAVQLSALESIEDGFATDVGGPRGGLSAVAAITEQPRLTPARTDSGTGATTTTGERAGSGLAGRVITIDAAHASNPDMSTEPIGPGASQMKEKDPGGASGVTTSVPEYMVTLSISVYLKDMLEDAGATVVMTRSGDGFNGGNVERAEIANSSSSSLFISIHCSGSDNAATGGASTLYPALVEGWTDDIYDRSRRAAELIQPALVQETGAVDGGVVERKDMTGFNWSDVPVVLVEAGDLTNQEEDAKFATPEYQQQVARGIFTGIQNYFS